MAGYHCPMPIGINIAEGHDKNKRVAIYDLTYSALKVHQNTGRGEVKRNPCIEFVNM